MRGTLYRIAPDNTIKITKLQRTCTLTHLKDRLDGGHIELIPGFRTWKGRDCVAFCDEEGKLKSLPFNRIATSAWACALGCSLMAMSDVLVGPVVVVFGDDEFMEML